MDIQRHGWTGTATLNRVGGYSRRGINLTPAVRSKKLLGTSSTHPGPSRCAIERALDEEAGCDKVMHLIAGVRGATAGLMAEVV